MLGRMGTGELLLILAVVLLIFGPSKLPALAKSMGQVEEGLQKLANEPAEATQAEPAKKAEAPSSAETK